MTLDSSEAAAAHTATAGQSSLFYAEQRLPYDGAFSFPTILKVRGAVSDTDLLAACRRLGSTTPALRLRFGLDAETGRVVQWTVDEVPDAELADFSSVGAETLEEYAEARALELFDVDEGALSRMIVVRCGPDEAAIVMIAHHLVIDGVSHPAMARRMGDAISGTLAEQSAGRYFDVVRGVLAAEDEARRGDVGYWLDRIPSASRLPRWELPDPHGAQGDAEGRLLVTLTPDATSSLMTAVDAAGVGMFAFLVSAIYHSLPVSRDAPAAVCAAASVRPQTGEYDDVIGCFINEVPMIMRPSDLGSISEFARRSAAQWRSDLRRRNYPFAGLADRVARHSGQFAMSLNSVIVSYRHVPASLSWTAGGVEFSADLYPRYPRAKNDISIRFFHHSDHLRYEVQWGHRLAPAGNRFARDLRAVLDDGGEL